MYGCFFHNERRVIEGTLILGVGPTIFAMFKLMKMRDVFGIGPEIITVAVPLLTTGGMLRKNTRVRVCQASNRDAPTMSQNLVHPSDPHCSHRMFTCNNNPV